MYTVKKDKIKRNYEFTFLLPGDFTQTEIDKSVEAINELLKKYKGELISEDDWGKKALSYKIRKGKKTHSQAVYKHWVINLEPEKLQDFNSQIELNKEIIRHLVIVVDNKKEIHVS